ncbi:hypothetical protein [Halocola ammonii]
MKSHLILSLAILLTFAGCKKDDPEEPTDSTPTNDCPENAALDEIENRNFGMGFTTWPYEATQERVEDTYDFLGNNGSIYYEHLDNRIPWDAFINDTSLPEAYVNDVQGRVNNAPADLDFLLSVSILNNGRTDLIEDYSGNIPVYENLNDPEIAEAYTEHLTYLINQLDPDYLVMSLESNELLINSPEKWESYKLLMAEIRTEINTQFPGLPVSESMTLHNWLSPDIDEPQTYINEISDYVTNFDFTAVSFYPYFKGLSSEAEFQTAFDFLHSQTSSPIAFVETAHLAENLVVENLNLSIESDECEQNDYLETLLLNAQEQDYEFVIWWAHRDFDALWETLPSESQDLAKIWRDTGLLDEDGNERPAIVTWREMLEK